MKEIKTKTPFAIHLELFRKKNGWTQQELLENFRKKTSTKLSTASLSLYEKGSRVPRAGLLKKFSDYLDVPVEVLLGKRTNEFDFYNFDDINNTEEQLEEKTERLEKMIGMIRSNFSHLSTKQIFIFLYIIESNVNTVEEIEEAMDMLMEAIPEKNHE